MIRRFFCSLAVFLVISMSGCQQSTPDGHDAHGRAIHLADYHGRWVVLNYWATWCKPCIKELTELNQLAVAYPRQLIVLGVNFDQLPNNKLIALQQKFAVHFPFLSRLNLGDRFDAVNVKTLPTTLILDQNGKLVYTLARPQTEKGLIQLLKLDHK